MTTSVEKIPAEALKFHFCDDASVCEFAESGDDGKIPVKIKARSRGPIPHWYWGLVIHDMAGMKLSKPRMPLDYCHRDDQILGAVNQFDTESGDLLAEGFMDSADELAAEIARKARLGVPYEASIFFDPRTIEAERLSNKETATVNGVTVRGPVTIIRKWTLRGVAVCPYGYDPKTSTRFSQDDCDVSVTLLSHDPAIGDSTMSVDQRNEETDTLANTEPTAPPAGSTELSDKSGDKMPSTPPAGSTELDAAGGDEKPTEKTAPGQAFIDRFGLQQGAVYFAQGLSMDEATAKHSAAVEKENAELKAKLAAAMVDLGSEEPVSFSGEGKPAGEKQKGSGDPAVDAFCANTKLPGRS